MVKVYEMKSSLCTMISIFGFSTILLLHRAALAAPDPSDLFKSEWQDTKEHPPLSRTDNQKKYFTNLSPKKGKRLTGKPCTRKEYRTLSDDERTKLHKAFNDLKTTGLRDGTNRTEYDVLVGYHRYDVAMGAHYGPAFLCWHREFLIRLERALLGKNAFVCLPYFDWTLDQQLPVPGDSAVWTSKYLGNNYGAVISGFAANWPVYPKDCGKKWPTLTRWVVQDSTGKNRLYTDQQINTVLAKRSYPDICVPYNNLFESYHNSAHVYVGGQMNMLSCSPNDPVFFFHHCFVDCVWEEFRTRHQKTNLETDYPMDSDVPDNHGAYETMWPFDNLRNIDGLSNNYTNTHYYCESRPMMCIEHKDCKSEILWCNKAIGRCSSKIREGGKCKKLPNEACYSENCESPTNVNGICKCP